jgi:intracellular septation protein A
MLFLIDLIKTLFEVILKSLGYIIDIFFIMMTLTIIYAALGMMLFGGEVYIGTTDLVNELSKTTTFDEKIFDGLNFNDYYNSLQTLIIILVSDYVAIAQINNNLEKGKIYLSIYLFHISFTILSKICLLNIIFGFLIDNC